MKDNNTVAIFEQIKFKVGDELKSFEICEMTIEQLEKYMRTANMEAEKVWLNRLNAIADTLPHAEKNQFLIDAAQEAPDLDRDVNKWLITDEGLKYPLVTVCPELEAVWDSISTVEENGKAIIRAWQLTMGIKEDLVKISVDESAAEKNG